MPAQKRVQILILVAVALALVAFSVIATLMVAHHMENGGKQQQTKSALGIAGKRPRFELFAGHGLCEKTIYKEMEGKILKLSMDSRTAQYDDFERTNTLLFSADVIPPGTKFLSEQLSTVKMNVQCVTSADTNELLTFIIAPADK